ncbi:type VI secretion system tip protein TssI/VgrG [uncultured Roseobacter sp.]|uniref:type VI secretion system Vgr family protein n=1 Tax=uncultured Roseobacter sp. TaxID=114847 RepID=UPI002623BEAC|nr:type VI secretion system tip protein TssI/VgrG [uncultured Roseobacter sp.]
MSKDILLENRPARLKLPNGIKGYLVRAQIDEALAEIPRMTVEFMSTDLDLDLQKLVGERLGIDLDAPRDKLRHFQGRCVSAEFLGASGSQGYFRAELRSWLWFLTQTTNCRIFQDKTVMEILREVFGAHGFSDFKDKTKHSFVKRSYCVQYRESDFAFISRLMEEEGIYYFHTYDKARETLVLVDDASCHLPTQDHPTLNYYMRAADMFRDEDHIYEWRGSERIRPGKVTLQGHDFEAPKTDLTCSKALPKGRGAHVSYEVYDASGRHTTSGAGEHHAQIRAEAYAAQTHRARAVGNVRQMAVGARFQLKKHPRKAENADYLVLRARHQIQLDVMMEDRDIVQAILGPVLDFDHTTNPDLYRCEIEVQPARDPYRSPHHTPRPENPGVQTAVVVGKAGEEVWTDSMGRVKVQFHWDRDGKRDETSSCWIRSAVPWSGKGWGMVAVPRIGQEVVVQFEQGDPDRPIITGMVYNGDAKPPTSLPGDGTQTGVRTNSAKGGNGCSELIFEDKKDAEFVRLQSERDFKQIIKNSAEIEVGLEHKSPGGLTQTIHGDKTETIREGDHSFIVAKGGETRHIAKDHTTTVDGALTLTAKSNITLKCGASEIELTPGGVTISAPKIDVNAQATAKVAAGGQLALEGKGQASLKGSGMLSLEGGGMTQLKSSGILTVKGSLTMIN